MTVKDLVATVPPGEMFKGAPKVPVNRASRLARYLNDLGLTSGSGVIAPTDAGRRYVAAGDPDDRFAVTDGQATILRDLFRQRGVDGLYEGVALALSLWNSSSDGREIQFEDFGQALGLAGGVNEWTIDAKAVVAAATPELAAPVDPPSWHYFQGRIRRLVITCLLLLAVAMAFAGAGFSDSATGRAAPASAQVVWWARRAAAENWLLERTLVFSIDCGAPTCDPPETLSYRSTVDSATCRGRGRYRRWRGVTYWHLFSCQVEATPLRHRLTGSDAGRVEADWSETLRLSRNRLRRPVRRKR